MHITLGVAAHVDAGKTTLCEQILAHAGVLRKTGRVDHGDAFMDDNALERERGITIFCEQASFDLPKPDGEALHVTLMDTPGHVDFAGEMERALSVLDAALLVVSCADGVQSHTVTLFRMLRERNIPTMIFLNKTDRDGADIPAAMTQMQRLLSPDCVLMAEDTDALCEELAARDEMLMEQHFDGAAARADYLAGAKRAFLSRGLFPVLPGSALMDRGVDALLEAVAALAETPCEGREREAFSAKVYRVRRIDGMRVCYLRCLSGTLGAKDEIETISGAQKINAIYAAQGERLTVIPRLVPGQTAAVSGLSARPGERVGQGAALDRQSLTPLMSVEIQPKPPLDTGKLLAHLRELEEEDPLLSVRPEKTGIAVGIMGAVQIEVLESVLARRFGDAVTIQPPKVLYRETVAKPVVGIGHYEPLRHYAEAWIRLVPGKPGSGVAFEAACAPNTLEVSWQRLIRQYVMGRAHPGVLTGSPLTDVTIQLIAGRSHLKHTEGGDFRESTYRAIRNALMQAENVLLEPMVRFELAMPQEALARVTGELLRMGASPDAPEYDGDEVKLSGECTAAAFWDYPTHFAAATRGHGRIASRFSRYAPCAKQDEIVKEIGYNPMADEQNPPGSVFCAHGAGFYVAWDHVREWAHCEVEGL